MSKTIAQREKHLRHLFFEQEGKCKICGTAAYLELPKNNSLAAVRFRTGSSYGAPGRTRLRVMAHRKCAQERSDRITASQDVDDLRHRAQRWPTEFYSAQDCSSTAEQAPYKRSVEGSNPSGPTTISARSSVGSEQGNSTSKVEGSSPSAPTNFATVAQSAEHRLCKATVGGSIPPGSSTLTLHECKDVQS